MEWAGNGGSTGREKDVWFSGTGLLSTVLDSPVILLGDQYMLSSCPVQVCCVDAEYLELEPCGLSVTS